MIELLSFTRNGWADYLSWQGQGGDKRILRRVNRLIEEIKRDPKTGIGKPERLREDLSGCSSRRIDGEHRLVYRVCRGTLTILSCRYHY